MPTKITFLTEKIARVQITQQNSCPADSALNKYGFIHDIAKAELAPLAMSFKTNEDNSLQCFHADGSLLFDMQAPIFAPKAAHASFIAAPDEDWIGFGDQTRKRLYHRGNKATCWVSNVASYLPVPFFMSTKGYGILVNTTHTVIFDLCKTDPNLLSWNDARCTIDFYVFAAPTFKEMISLYTDLTGKPQLPPEWAFGLWYICRTQANDAEVINDAVNMRREGIPCDLIGLEPGWMDIDYDPTTTKSWSKERFPLPDWQKKGEFTFIKALKRMGFHLELWLCNDYDLSYEEERKLNAHKSTPNDDFTAAFDNEAELDYHFAEPRYMDKITKKDEAWFKHLEKFVDWGADFFKQDGAYQVCIHPDRLYGNGMTDAEMHNLYPLLYSRQMWEGFANYTNRRPVVFTPSGWVGFQAWCGTWTGDTGGRLETLGAMLNTSIMGHCWATNDMEVTQPEGIHFGYLQPWSQINSWTYFRMPWAQGDKLLDLHQFYARFRATLIPYIYASARACTISGLPLMMPLTLEYQNDPNCRDILHEYLLGRDLLVSIFKHDIYLPEGKWMDFWTKEIYEGKQTIHYDWPEGKGGGLFIREGAIIPFGPLMQYRHEKPLDTIDLLVFPKTETTSFDLYEDDGVSFNYKNGDFSLTNISVRLEGTTAFVTIKKAPNSEVKQWNITTAQKNLTVITTFE